MSPDFGPAHWDARYRALPTVWGAAPNRWVEQEVGGLAPGTALDLACGEGRNAVWLAGRGWHVTAVDFSGVALAKGVANDETGRVTWVLDDVTGYVAHTPVDLVLIAYLHLRPAERAAVVRTAARALAPGATLLVVAHDARNRTDGIGGPQDPEVLYTAADLVHDLGPADLMVERAEEVLRMVDGASRPGIDCLLRARRAG